MSRIVHTTGNQVTPFRLDTPDGVSLYAWHVLPLPLYLKNEAALASQPAQPPSRFEDTESFKILKRDPEARLVLYCKCNSYRRYHDWPC